MPALPRRRRKQFYVRRKVCRLWETRKLPINYKETTTLRQFVERGRVEFPPAYYRELRPPSAPPHPGHQTGPAPGVDAVCALPAAFVSR